VSAEDTLTRRVAAMRDGFDSSFARPEVHAPTTGGTRVLVVRVGAIRYAVPLADCAALLPAPSIRALPTTVGGFRGVTLANGALVAVYDLAALLRIARLDDARWLLVTAGPDQIGLLAEAIEGHGHTTTNRGGDDDEVPVVDVNGIHCRLLQVPRLLDELRQIVGRDFSDRSEAG
jgi:hypothetical protein